MPPSYTLPGGLPNAGSDIHAREGRIFRELRDFRVMSLHLCGFRAILLMHGPARFGGARREPAGSQQLKKDVIHGSFCAVRADDVDGERLC